VRSSVASLRHSRRRTAPFPNPAAAWWPSPSVARTAAGAGGDPLGTIRDSEQNGIHVIPAWEYDVSEEEYKAGMEATTVTR
jgi:hypothetical protein